jgi:hypothetical protein
MSKKAIYNALTRAFLDPNFRQELAADIRATLRKLGEEVSPEEEQEIRRALEEGSEAGITGLDQRLSKSGVSLSPQALLQQRSRTGRQALRVDDLRQEVRRQMMNLRLGPGQEDKIQAVAAKANFDAVQSEGDDANEPDYEVEKD